MTRNAPTSAKDEQADRLLEKLRREMGPLICSLLVAPGVIEIMLNPDGQIWVERFGEPMQAVGSMTANAAESLIGTVAASLKTAVNRSMPILECELPGDGSRFEALIPPVVSAPVFTIRRKAERVYRLDDYVSEAIMTAEHADVIRAAVIGRQNILVVGGTGSGKTTLTNAIISVIAEALPEERLVIIEDTNEIQCRSSNAVILRASGATSMLDLLRATMRLRPDRILVGEVRGPEALALLKAWNTGHPGGIATVHANGAVEGLARIETLVAEQTAAPMQSVIATAINTILFIERTAQGRKLSHIVRVEGFSGGEYQLRRL